MNFYALGFLFRTELVLASLTLIEGDVFLLRNSEAELTCLKTLDKVSKTDGFHFCLCFESQRSNMWKKLNFGILEGEKLVVDFGL